MWAMPHKKYLNSPTIKSCWFALDKLVQWILSIEVNIQRIMWEYKLC